jgi:hypothetical protein
VKAKLFISAVWLIGTFLLLSEILYAANDYDRGVLAAITDQRGEQPTLEHVKALEKQIQAANTFEEAINIQDTIWKELGRYFNAQNEVFLQRRMIERVWLLWIVSALVPLLFIWWPHLARRGGSSALPVSERQCVDASTSVIH